MSNDRLVKTFVAAADYSAKKGYAMYLANTAPVSGTPVATICGSDARGIGIIVDPPYGSGYPMDVCVSGYCQAIAGGAITAGAYLISDGNGALVVTTTDKNHVIGIAMEAAAASGEMFEIEINKYDLAA